MQCGHVWLQLRLVKQNFILSTTSVRSFLNKLNRKMNSRTSICTIFLRNKTRLLSFLACSFLLRKTNH